MNLFNVLVIFNSVTLSVYGLSCLCSSHMVDEFKRYGLPQFRVMVGTFEVLGSLGVLVGLYVPLIGMLAAIGLSILLFCGFAVRVKIKDGVFRSIPALMYFIINLYIAFEFTLN